MKRYQCIVVLFFIILQLLQTAQAKSNEKVLVIYSISKGEHSTYVQSVIHDVMMTGAYCSSISSTMYNKDLMDSYTCVVIVNLADKDINAEVHHDLTVYKGKILWLGNTEPDLANDSYQTIISQRTLLNNTLGVSNEHTGLYLKIDYVYPVSDFNLISSMGEYLKEKNVPFIFVAMPFYNNIETQAAKNYGKLLRYLIDCGGTPIIHCPVFTQLSDGDMPLPDEVLERLNIAISNLATLDIFPVAIEMPEAYLRRNDFDKVFNCFSHYFAVEGTGADVYTVSPNTPFPILQNALTNYITLNESIYEVRLPKGIVDTEQEAELFEKDEFLTTVSSLANSQYTNYAVSLPSWLHIEEFKSMIDALRNKNIQFLDFSYGTQSVHLGVNNIDSKFGMVTYNGKLKIILPVTEENAVPSGNELVAEIEGFLKRGNLFIIIFSSTAIVILIMAFLVGKKKDKEKFFKRR